ncbi:CPBP family intramembrane glutamic endopeptidase [Aquimarina hainanensis]|uniref:CPBP family intramembrane glutamic endopeptidase n=1 Tax=Aquimarina hainanensis TaxID=1578017 RepID=A0ABW5NER5_9FLAO
MNVGLILTYGSLVGSVLFARYPLLVLKRVQLWQLVLVISLGAALVFGYATSIAIGYGILYGGIIFWSQKTKNTWVFLLSLVAAIPLLFHFSFTGFHNFKYLDAIRITETSSPYSLYFNLDKTLIAVFILGFSGRKKEISWKRVFSTILPVLGLMSTVFIALALMFGYAKFEWKLPYFTPVWILINLLFVCTAEEVLFRKWIQTRLEDSMRSKNKHIVAIAISAVLFGLAHYTGGVPYILLSTIAGCFYGYVYYKTKRIESAVLLHFLFNLLHFVLFSYPSYTG